MLHLNSKVYVFITIFDLTKYKNKKGDSKIMKAKNFTSKIVNGKISIEFNNDCLSYIEVKKDLFSLSTKTLKGNSLHLRRLETGDDYKNFVQDADLIIEEYLDDKENIDFKYNSMLDFTVDNGIFLELKNFNETDLDQGKKEDYESLKKELGVINLQYSTIEKYFLMFKRHNIL